MLPPKPPLSPKHVEERLKLLANGLQNLAVLLLGGVFVTPLLNASFIVTWPERAGAALLIAAAEGTALLLLRRIPMSEP